MWNGIELSELVFATPRLTLRPWRAEDAPAVFRAMQDPGMHEFLALPDPYTADDAQKFVTGPGDEGRAAGTGVGCAIVDATDRLLGSCALRLPTKPTACAEIGYWVAPDARGRGVAAAATRILAEWGLANGLARIEIFCAVQNLASARAALAAGFRFEAVQPGRINFGPYLDGAVFGRTPLDDGAPIPPAFAPFPAAGLFDDAVALRPVAPGDADALLDEATNPLTLGWAFTDRAPTATDMTRRAASAQLDWLVGGSAHLAIIERASAQVAGGITIRKAGPPNIGGIGYGLRPDFRGHGYTTRALRLLVPWAFGAGGFQRLELGAKIANIASQKSALAAGFIPDGVRTQRLRNPDGTFSDEARFCLNRPA